MYGYKPAPGFLLVAGTLLFGFSTSATAQMAVFADDFSSNSIRYSTERPDDSVGAASTTVSSDGLLV